MGEIRGLTGIRGVAAVIVFFAHTRETLESRGLFIEIPELALRLFLSAGRQVDIFFVLSGFVLALNYSSWFKDGVSKATYGKFIQRRFARIYPLHVALLLIVVALVVAANTANISTQNGLERFRFITLPEHFLLMHAWNMFGHGDGTWNPPSWSISIEAVAYLLFPLAIWGVSTWSKNHRWLLVTLVAVIGLALNAATQWGLYGFSALARGLSEFMFGCVVANLFGTRASTLLGTTLGGACSLAILAIGFALVPSQSTGFVVALVGAPLLLTLCKENFVSKFFGWQPVYFLGEISYSVYLGHFIFSSVAYRIISIEWMKSGPVPCVTGIAFILGFVLFVSCITYYAIEKPCRNLLRGKRKEENH